MANNNIDFTSAPSCSDRVGRPQEYAQPCDEEGVSRRKHIFGAEVVEVIATFYER